MKQTEIIAHLRSLRKSQADFARTNGDEIFKRDAEEAERVTVWQAAAEFGRSASDTWENANSATKTLADALYKPEDEQ